MKFFKNIHRISFVILVFGCCLFSFSQQKADNIELPKLENPKFKVGMGPKTYIDQSHYNFHTQSGRFKPFSDLLKLDGFKVDSIINFSELESKSVLVISNAINSKNLGNWKQPIYPAFNDNEIYTIKKWVESGGRLLLIADHMPFAGAANSLANAFGFSFCDGFAQLKHDKRNQPDVFSETNLRLVSSKITNGNFGKKITSVTTFTGSSFLIPNDAIGILKFKKGDACLQPEIAWQFNKDTKTKDLENSYQGAILNYGKGKIAVFGEAAMFTAQTITNNSDTFKFGFHSENAPNNIDFIRNLMYWLTDSK